MLPILLSALLALTVAPGPASASEPPRPETAPWVVKRVSADGRTLVLWAQRGGCDPETSATATETAGTVEIRVQYAAPPTDGPCPAIMIFDRLRVRLQEPIAGRALIGQSLTEAPPALRVPRVTRLDAQDARFALRAQGLRPTGMTSGEVTWQTPWPGSAVRGTRPNEVYLSNPRPEPRPAVLGPLRFRTIAQGSGATSRFREPAGLVVGSEARWTRVWRRLTGSDRARPQVDFERRRLLVVVQGRRPSAWHGIRVNRVDRLPGGIVVDVRERSPAGGCPAPGVVTSPYHVVSIPRSDQRVDFVRTHRTTDCAERRRQPRA